MRTKRSREGEIFIDHRASPGLTDEQLAGFGVAVAGGKVFESATIVCSHCQTTVVLNPDRSRERGWCPKCDKYLCDECEYVRSRTFECREYARHLDDLQDQIERGGSTALLLHSAKG